MPIHGLPILRQEPTTEYRRHPQSESSFVLPEELIDLFRQLPPKDQQVSNQADTKALQSAKYISFWKGAVTTIRFFAVLPLLRGLRRAPNGGKAGRRFLAVRRSGLVFDKPQRLTRIALVFDEKETERTQEFSLRWSEDGGRSFREIVRQQCDPLSLGIASTLGYLG